jgi:hypothetical protein
MQLMWMLISKQYTAADGALMPGLVTTYGLAAIAGDGVFFELWPSEPPEHIDDLVTLTLFSGSDVTELGRFATYDEAKAAAQEYFDEHGAQLRGNL